MSQLDFAKINQLAEQYKPEMTAFLRDMVAIPSESCDEKAVVARIKEEMEKVGFDKAEIDPMGNVLGTIGHGKHVIAMDAHIDTVGIGNRDNWKFDPYEGYEDEETIGRAWHKRSGRRHGLHGLCRKDHQGSEPGR